MYRLLLIIPFYLIGHTINAQNGHDIITGLKSINAATTGKSCHATDAAAISHRAMNVFLADKTSYLSAARDLSFFTNYVTYNTGDGKFTVNHNFQPPHGADDPIRTLFSFGFDMTIAGSYAKSFLDKRFENEVGVTASYKWLGKVKTRFAGCDGPASQKTAMDAARAALIAQLQQEITAKETAFTLSLDSLDAAAIPGQQPAGAKMTLLQHFYADLKTAYEEKFALGQAVLLTNTANFKTISTGWTSLTAYLPVYFPKYTVAPSFTTAFSGHRPYPASITLAHTRMWEMKPAGRLFFTLEASILFNNAKLGHRLSKLNFSEYKSLGGTAIQQSPDPGNNKLYIGEYSTFVTPLLAARLVYFPPNSHVGISVLAEKNFGDVDPISCRIGVPVVLINSKKTPAFNLECFVSFFDLANTTHTTGRTTAGLAIGIPFSRLMF